jgi:hypothetical protein
MDMAEYNHVVEKDGDVLPDKVESVLNRMDSGKKEEILTDFSEFKSYC